jgi:glycosyltransferase involved in cell wall biosynthesis
MDDSIGSPILSIIIPSLNEAESLTELLPTLAEAIPGAEVIVVNDGSIDSTRETAANHSCVVINNPFRMGNGAAIKRGAREARGSVLAMLDADGQHTVADLMRLWQRFQREDLDMLVGARKPTDHASGFRRFGNFVFNKVASWMTGQKILDLTSGMRVVDAHKFREFLHLLPNGFSYPTTSTMAFFRSGYAVAYEPISVGRREGRSHLKIWREGVRFLVIIFKIGALYSPLKLFLPVSLGLFLMATALYIYTYLEAARFTNMSALLYMTSLLTFLIGIVSEQITALMFARRERD